MDISDIGRWLVGIGVGAAVIGVLLVIGGAMGLGRLPGDLTFGGGRVRVYVPLVTCIVLSIVATIVANLLLRR